ncbi:hypothetical protein [Tsukamurella tyrosinosolvens]|uniref:hypothetical protein n=1 Tax=Tsukamurella tyrosinosolvens TaxID=57704 RepID=UPI000DF6A434|nr:hypothetical protein [Tsukamurella tyrosinosolvens]RDB49369.1 hypothetical protein DVB87_03300 [Tsukamurella tyrosinosolvens]
MTGRNPPEHHDDSRLTRLQAEFVREEQQLTARFYDARPYLRTVPVDEWTDDELDAHAECVGDFYDRRTRATAELCGQVDAELAVRLRDVIASGGVSDRIRSLLQAYVDGLTTSPTIPNPANPYAVPSSPPYEPDVHHAWLWTRGRRRALSSRRPYSGLAELFAGTGADEPDDAYYDAAERSPHLFPELYDAEGYEQDVREMRRLGVPD